MKKLKLFATLRDVVGAKEITVPFEEGQTVRDLIQSIHSIHPVLGEQILTEDGQLTGLVQVLVHGRNISWLQGLETHVSSDDIVILLPPSAGG